MSQNFPFPLGRRHPTACHDEEQCEVDQCSVSTSLAVQNRRGQSLVFGVVFPGKTTAHNAFEDKVIRGARGSDANPKI